MRGRITKSSVEQLAEGERLWDHGHREVVKGFGVRRQGDAITYYVRFRFQGNQRMCALGSHVHLTPDEARILAKSRSSARLPAALIHSLRRKRPGTQHGRMRRLRRKSSSTFAVG